MNKFLTERYDDIITMSKKICKSSSESEDVAHFAIESFMYHERGQELVDSGRGMNFLSGIIHRSFHSSTSQYHTLYRQKGRVHALPQDYDNKPDDNTYDHNIDSMLEAVQGILEDMKVESTAMWYRATLLEQYMEAGNYSEIARRTNIPRTSISIAVEEAKAYIKERLNIHNITWD